MIANLMQSPWLEKIGIAVTTAALIAGGSTIVDNKNDNTRQDVEIQELSRFRSKIQILNDELDEANKNLAVMNERLRHND